MPSPVKRARAITDMAPGFPKAPKPDGWREWSLGQRIEFAFGCALDRAMDYLSWPPEDCNPHMLAAQKEAVSRMILIGAKYGIEAARTAQRQEMLEALHQKLTGMEKPPEGG